MKTLLVEYVAAENWSTNNTGVPIALERVAKSSDISAQRIEAVKFICRAAVRPVCREGNNNDTLYVYTMENGSRQQAHNAQASTHTSERSPVLSGSHYSVCVTLPGISRGRCYLSSVYRLYEGRFEFLPRLDRSLQYERRATFYLPPR